MQNYDKHEVKFNKRVKLEKKILADNYDKIHEKRSNAATSVKRVVK